MSLGPEHEGVLAPAGAGLADALSFAFAESPGGICGRAEIRVGADASGRPRVSGFAMLMAEGQLVACRQDAGPAPETAAGGGDLADPVGGWHQVAAAGLRTSIREPLARWSVTLAGAGDSFDLEFTAVRPAVFLDRASPASQASATESYEHVCRVTGQVTVGGVTHVVECSGQRGHRWGALNAGGGQLRRDIGAWLGEPGAVVMAAVRPPGAADHAAEVSSAFVIEGEPGSPGAMAEARLSTTYDHEHHPLRTSLELWAAPESDFPRRLAGDTIARGCVELDGQRIECAFLAWHMEGHAGMGRYEIERST